MDKNGDQSTESIPRLPSKKHGSNKFNKLYIINPITMEQFVTSYNINFQHFNRQVIVIISQSAEIFTFFSPFHDVNIQN